MVLGGVQPKKASIESRVVHREIQTLTSSLEMNLLSLTPS